MLSPLFSFILLRASISHISVVCHFLLVAWLEYFLLHWWWVVDGKARSFEALPLRRGAEFYSPVSGCEVLRVPGHFYSVLPRYQDQYYFTFIVVMGENEMQNYHEIRAESSVSCWRSLLLFY